MILGVLLALKEAHRKGYKSDLIFDFIIMVLPIAIICARLYYVIFEWKSYSNNPLMAFAIWEGGLAIYGGIIGGFVTAIIFSKINKFSLLKLVDILIPSLILGQAIGRWGNFVNQEAFGNLVINESLKFFPYAVFIEDIAEWHQATFLYESIWNLIIFTILILYKKKSKFDGNLLSIYMIMYGTGRFFIEGLRTDSLYLIANIRVSQVLSIVLVLVGIFMITFHKKIFKQIDTYVGKY